MNKRLQTPLAKARGLGSAKEGVHHWWMQRLTAIALVPLTLWFLYSMLTLINLNHGEFVQWLAQPVNAVLSLLTICTMLYHAMLGVQVIIEDYVHCKVLELTSMIGMKFTFLALGVISVFCILKIALGA